MGNMIEVGEYVRLARNQGINKIRDIEDNYYFFLDDEIADEWGDTTEIIKKYDLQDEILKHSKNIIDLIEVGDYVNGKLIHSIYGNLKNGELMLVYGNGKHFDNKHIKSILTKEQYNQNCYRLEETC